MQSQCRNIQKYTSRVVLSRTIIIPDEGGLVADCQINPPVTGTFMIKPYLDNPALFMPISIYIPNVAERPIKLSEGKFVGVAIECVASEKGDTELLLNPSSDTPNIETTPCADGAHDLPPQLLEPLNVPPEPPDGSGHPSTPDSVFGIRLSEDVPPEPPDLSLTQQISCVTECADCVLDLPPQALEPLDVPPKPPDILGHFSTPGLVSEIRPSEDVPPKPPDQSLEPRISRVKECVDGVLDSPTQVLEPLDVPPKPPDVLRHLSGPDSVPDIRPSEDVPPERDRFVDDVRFRGTTV